MSSPARLSSLRSPSRAIDTCEHHETNDYLLSEVFQKPHTVTLFFIMALIVATVPFYYQQTVSATQDNVKRGFLMMGVVYIMYSTMQPRDVPFTRPHPLIWRMFTGVIVIYVLVLVFVLYQSVDDVRFFLTYLDPTLNQPLPEKDYAANCDVYTPHDPHSYFKNVSECLFDRFVPAHFLGWWIKALVIRDPYMCWFLSILFELMEITFSHMLPNFKECWWDSIVLDILLCNGGGIICGGFTLQFLAAKQYNWVGLSQIPNVSGKIKRVLSQFSPENWTVFKWDIFKSANRFASFWILVLTATVLDLNAFFLKYILWIPYTHEFNVYRLWLWAVIAAMGVRQYYDYIIGVTPTMGQVTWLACAGILLEFLICIKMGVGMFPLPTPEYIIWFWALFATAVVLLWLLLLVRDLSRPSFPKSDIRRFLPATRDMTE
eukprot:gnl/Spiro4/22142_TR10903_c0_g1_i1.p1 gnl/Spiro4/22142_TR10903_c0_g1~~gnl/Spiro4/22142_TR10903_c0_g1_i1.p1  ORF type:complete len:461 (-),score=94.21 gnl/Spiro4/22142_TR10903_c0_g1_i1:60-1355(-)